jgi:hypothetical protein
MNHMQLKRTNHTVAQDVFDVEIDKGAPDGHRVAFHGKANAKATGEPGDVCFVLQERRHATWRRKGADLFTERSITLLEALAGYQIVITHLDGRRLAIKSRPGEIVKPRNLLLDAEAEWDRHENTDAFPGEDAGCMRTDDLEACKELCRQRGLNGFTYWEDTAYFRAQSRENLLAARKPSKGSTLFVCPDPHKSASVRMQRAIRDAGMPRFGDPSKRGNLFLLLRVELPRRIDANAAELLQEVLAPGYPQPLPAAASGREQDECEELVLVDLDYTESMRQHHIVTGGSGGHVNDNQDEAPPAGSPGPPPPGCYLM